MAARFGRWYGWTRMLAVAGLLAASAPLSAQFYYFGRNKVQWTDFEWHVLKTEHFEIYYYPEMENLARRGAAFAEEAYHELEQRFNQNVLQPIPLIFYSSHLHFEQTNTAPGFIPEGVGGFFEFLKGRVVIPSDGSTAQFRRVIRHELVHVFMHSKIARVIIDHRQPQDRTPPLWFSEGLAEYWSSDWDTQAEMVMRDAVVNNYVVPLTDMDRIFGTFLMYKEGQNICQYIARRYGDEALLLLMDNFWKSGSFSEVMHQTIGKTYEEFDKDWLYALKKQYYPELRTDDLPGNVTENVVDEGFNAKPTVYAHDGVREVLFIGNHRGYTSIYRANPDTVDPESQLVVEGEQTSDLESFHPFQSKIAVSRDGILAFVTKSDETDVLHLFDLKSGSMRETLRFRNLVVIGSPSWSPDGRRIVFSSIDKSGNNDLYIYDLGDRSLVRVTNDLYDDRDPAWSPDGKWIAFSSDRTAWDRGKAYNLFLFSLDRGTIDYLTAGEENDLAPAWSPDGTMLAFTSDRVGAQNVWVLRMKDGCGVGPAKRVTNYLTAAFDPAWGGKDDIIFTAFERFSFQIKRFEDISLRYDTSRVTMMAEIPRDGRPWTVTPLEGPQIVSNYRYAKDYSIDIAQSQISTDPVFGTTGGAALAMSDVLGNDQYYFLVYNTAQTQSEILDNFNVAITKVSLGSRTNFAYGIFRLAG